MHESEPQYRESLTLATLQTSPSQPIRKRRWFWVFFTLVGVLVISGLAWFKVYHSLVYQQAALHRAWTHLEEVHQQRYQYLNQIILQVKKCSTSLSICETLTKQEQEKLQFLALELQPIVMMERQAWWNYRAFSKKHLWDYVSSVQKKSDNFLQQMMRYAQQYRLISLQQRFQQLKESTEKIDQARVAFNHQATKFNRLIRQIPGRWVAQALSYKEQSLV
ncbi:LemA family protein [Magnetococcales bacterium HHB-1]